MGTGTRSSRSITTVIIGAGHSGLAMSRCLEERSIDHVILERGEVANTWKTERWDSLRLLTPNWQSRLPGYAYRGEDLDGFMTVPEVIEFIEGYAAFIGAPVETGTAVLSVETSGEGYRVHTNRGDWSCRAVVIASGGFNLPQVPQAGEALPSHIRQLSAKEYRNPEQLEAGGVLVVGASATGLQLAQEIQQSGRPVTLAVGEHVRMPRRYRGRDILWWMDKAGILDERYDEVDDIVRARNVPSPQLAGTPDCSTLDLNALSDLGVALVGRFAGANDGKALFSGSLKNVCALADLKMNRLLDSIDEWIAENDVDPGTEKPHRFPATRVEKDPRLFVDLDAEGIRAVIWATGYRPDLSWLHVPVLDRKGRIRHDGGVAASPGMYVLGLTFLRRRKSSFIHGAEDDARDLADHLASYLNGAAS